MDLTVRSGPGLCCRAIDVMQYSAPMTSPTPHHPWAGRNHEASWLGLVKGCSIDGGTFQLVDRSGRRLTLDGGRGVPSDGAAAR